MGAWGYRCSAHKARKHRLAKGLGGHAQQAAGDLLGDQRAVLERLSEELFRCGAKVDGHAASLNIGVRSISAN